MSHPINPSGSDEPTIKIVQPSEITLAEYQLLLEIARDVSDVMRGRRGYVEWIELTRQKLKRLASIQGRTIP